MPKLLSLEDWIKAYTEQHPYYAWSKLNCDDADRKEMREYLADFAQKLLTAAVADKLLQEALKPEPEEKS